VVAVADGLLGGRYRLHHVLGRGGMAVVWEADDQRLGRRVAVKVLDRAGLSDPSALAQFDREARTVAQLTHPNVVTVHDVGVDDGVGYLVMELVAGHSLADRLTRGPLAIDEATRIAGQVCAALSAAHAAGVVHRDVKPANILITPAGAAKVCEFGIAHDPHDARGARAAVATVTGTSEYMAPEQVSGGAVDYRADLYSLGCVLYAMLTGRPPFSGDTPHDVGWRHLHDEAVPVSVGRPGVSSDLSDLVGRLLAKDPAQRPRSAGDVSARLASTPGEATAADANSPVSAPTLAMSRDRPIRGSAAVMQHTQTMPALEYVDDPPYVGGRGIRLSPSWLAGLAVVFVAVVVLAIVALTHRQPNVQANPPVGAQSSATSTPTPPAPTTSAPSFGSPAQAISAIQAALQTQVQMGLDRGISRDLNHQLNDIQHEMNHGDGGGDAAGKVNDLGDKLSSLFQDGKISQAAYDTLKPMVDQLATLVSSSSGGDNNQG
jgi:serine/threonine-protein kinase